MYRPKLPRTGLRRTELPGHGFHQSHSVECSGFRTGVCDLRPIVPIPFPSIAQQPRVNATKQYCSLARVIVCHSIGAAGTRPDICYWRPVLTLVFLCVVRKSAALRTAAEEHTLAAGGMKPHGMPHAV